jgi:hypothetical protein
MKAALRLMAHDYDVEAKTFSGRMSATEPTTEEDVEGTVACYISRARDEER